MKVILRDLDDRLVAAWQREFVDEIATGMVEVGLGDIFDVKADAIVSPANSFGFMDGGIDYAYSEHFGWELQQRLQEHLSDTPNAFLAFRAAVREARLFTVAGTGQIATLLSPGMATACGKIAPAMAARQMHQGYMDAYKPARFRSLHDAQVTDSFVIGGR